jgi:hypothetical protein
LFTKGIIAKIEKQMSNQTDIKEGAKVFLENDQFSNRFCVAIPRGCHKTSDRGWETGMLPNSQDSMPYLHRADNSSVMGKE